MEYQLDNGCLRLLVSSCGAQMQAIEKDGAQYLWDGNEEYWPERAPLLFPFVGRFTEGKYRLDGQEYEMDIHGFARKLPFQVTEQTKEKISLELRDSQETFASYPYHFILQVSYTLQKNKIGIEYQVQNLTDKTMYFGIGGHPGFRVPLENGLDFEDYYLEFAKECRPERVGHTKACFLSGVNEEFPLEDGRILRLSHDLFDDDAIVLAHMADEVALKSDKGSRQVRVAYPDLPYLGLWHVPNTDAPYVCIEPWTSLPSRQGVVEDFQYKSDLIRLWPGRSYVNLWSITIE